MATKQPPITQYSALKMLRELADDFFVRAASQGMSSFNSGSTGPSQEQCKSYGRADAYNVAAHKLREIEQILRSKGWSE